MNTLAWVLVGLGLYMAVALWLDAQDVLPEYVVVQGPITTLHTQRGKRLLDRLARPRRLWRAWGNLGVGIALVVMAGTFLFLVASAVAVLQSPPPPSQVTQPRNVLVIPGVNDFLPLSVAPEIVFGLVVGLVVHEGGHGLLCRVEDIDIDSMGLALLTVVPLGAFVEPDEESRDRADRGGRTRMFAAGVTNNLAVTVLAFLLLLGPVAGSIGVVAGGSVGAVLPGSAADRAGLAEGDVIVAVNGESVDSNEALETAIADTGDAQVEVTLKGGETTTVERSVLVTRVSQGAPVPPSIDAGTTITAVNGTAVDTEGELREQVADRPVAELTTEGGESVAVPIGAAVQASEGSPAAGAGLPTDRTVVLTHVDGERVVDAQELGAALDDTSPGDEVTVRAYDGSEGEEYAVTLGENPRDDTGFLGVTIVPGISGVTANDFGMQLYPADLYLGLLGNDVNDRLDGSFADTFLGRVLFIVMLPLASVANVGGLEFNFAGFTGAVTNFYAVEGPLAALGGAVFVAANLLFWTGWINLQLAFFNCIPAFPLDGGHILRTSTEAVLSRLPVDATRQHVQAVTTTVGVTMLLSLLLMIFGPRLLG